MSGGGRGQWSCWLRMRDMEGGLAIGYAVAFEIMPTTEERMYAFQFFSRWHNLSLVYILFNDPGNSSLFNHFLFRD